MNELKQIVGKNLSSLRKNKKLTQAELALKLNYSDKAISKWEHGDALPSLENLVAICDFYGITLDQLIKEGAENIKVPDDNRQNKTNKIAITLISFLTIYFIATIAYVGFVLLLNQYNWIFFIWSMPLSIIVLIIFNAVWGKRKYTFVLVCVLIWTLLAGFYITALLYGYNLWIIFLLGIPATIVDVLWSQIKKKH